jgi:hypothetical protein
MALEAAEKVCTGRENNTSGAKQAAEKLIFLKGTAFRPYI